MAETTEVPEVVADPTATPGRRRHHQYCITERRKAPAPREALCGYTKAGPFRAPSGESDLCPMCADLSGDHLANCLPCLEHRARRLRRGGS